MMTILNFETTIDPKILDRGFDYYESDLVVDFEKIEDGQFRGLAKGTELYDVKISLDSQLNITKSYCSCPYDHGPYCKHQVALMHYIKDAEAYKQDFKKKGKSHELVQAIHALPKQELVALIASICSTDRNTLNHFLLQLGIEDEEYEQHLDEYEY